MKYSLRLLALSAIVSLSIGITSFKEGGNEQTNTSPPARTKKKGISTTPLRNVPEAVRQVTSDPIRFSIQCNRQGITPGEEIELVVTAQLMNISPNLMFFLPGSNAYTLKMLLPDGFQQTGGSFSEYVTGELTHSGTSEATYTVRGYFTRPASNTCFRLLRSDRYATSQSLYVQKATLCITASGVAKPGAAREAATNSTVNWCAEAESGSGNRGTQSLSQASNGQAVSGFGNSSEYMDYSIGGVQGGGSYTLHLWYCSGETAQFGIVVNGNLQTASAGSNASWTGPFVETTIPINLQAGTNSLRIQGAGGTFVLDRLCVDGGSGGGCTPPGLSLGTPTCNGNSTYSVSFSTQAGTSVSSSAGSVQGNQVVNIPAGTNVTVSASLNGCSSQQTAFSPGCGGNPPTGSCSVSNPQSTLDDADCNGIRGWALDMNNLGQTQTIDIYIDGVKTYSGISANVDRPDVANYFNNPAARYHGFSYAFPADAPWKNGQNHTISVRMCGVNNDMPGSPKTAYGCTGGAPNPPTVGCGTGSGLSGFYSNTTDLSANLVAIRTDAKIDFTWGNNSPMTSVVNADGFSVRWYGQVEAPVSGMYTFKTNNDDGTRLWVNDQLLIDDWNGHPATWRQGSIYLAAGQKYPLEMVFVDYGGEAQAQLYWEYPGQSTQIIPSCRLYTSFSPTEYTVGPGTNVTNAPQPYGYCSVNINYLTFFLECYSGRIVDYVVYGPVEEPEDPVDPIFHPGDNYPKLPAGTGGGGGLPPGPWYNPGLPPHPVFIQTGLPTLAVTLNNFYFQMWSKGIFFTADEKAVLNRYPQLLSVIRAYVNQYNSKPDFVFIMDKYLEDTYAFVTSPGERAILANRPWQDQITFRANAISASVEAVIRFNNTDCQDNACNAYRHAFFNALNANSFTVPVARQLGQARENNLMIDPITLAPINFVCDGTNDAIAAAYMDLFNNEWGYRAFNQFQAQGGNLSAIVQTMANNGSLRNAIGCP